MKNYEIIDITRCDEKVLDDVKALYYSSFPEDERRPWDSIIEMIGSGSPFFKLRVIESLTGEFMGFLTTWNLPGTLYIEHFAISPSLRGSGTGGEVLKEITSQVSPLPVVVEVELPGDTPEAERRIAFYERNGFEAMRDFPYYQPPYRPDLESVPLMLMTTSPLPDATSFVIMLHTLVYNQ